MKESLYGASPIDHHIQLAVLRMLFEHPEPLAFSDLKPGDVDNGHFVYHLRKLQSRGLVQHDESGYRLTPDGARRVNFVSTDTLKPDLNPRLLVSFIVLNHDRTRLLISHRLSSVADHIGPYALPAGRHRYGMSLSRSAAERAEELFGQTMELQKIGHYETLHYALDGYVHHAAGCAFSVILDEAEVLPKEAHYELLWASVSSVLDGEYGEVLKAMAARYLSEARFDDDIFTMKLLVK